MAIKTVAIATDVKFHIHPSLRGGYMVTCIAPSEDKPFDQKIPLDKTKCVNSNFVHNANFCASFEFLADAIIAVQKHIDAV